MREITVIFADMHTALTQNCDGTLKYNSQELVPDC